MRPIYQNTVIHLDITNACEWNCANCTRHVGNHRKSYFMDLEMVRKGIASLDGFPGRVGIMGGNPTLHPKFTEILAIVREMIPDRRRREFWTSGFKWEEYKDIIFETFDEDRISFNDHSQTSGKHQPLMVAIEEVVKDPELQKILIDNCPFQARWSASITPKGGWFCEVAASMDYLFDGPGGYPVEPGWWDKEPEQFQDQVNWACYKCSGAIPMETLSDGRGGRDGKTSDTVSPGNLVRLMKAGSPKAMSGHIKLWEREITEEEIETLLPEWNPRSFRDFVAHTPEDVAENVK